ncbi:MAG: hypothetical protein CMJ83_18595 [Planctomycetes bacterium]|nr:hypothetical protein [Planctomycetota bacterium]
MPDRPSRTRSPAFTTTALLIASVLTAVGGAQDIVWRDLSKLPVEGRGWSDVASPFDRLPARAEKLVRKPVWGLSRESAGIAVRFATNAPQIHVRWTLRGKELDMPHMPASGVSGMDLYLQTKTGLRWVTNARPGKQKAQVRLVDDLERTPRTWMLYFPLYNGVTSAEIGIPDGCNLSPAPSRISGHTQPVVFYGTSITQGACASRPGMAHVAILGRRLDRPVINLGFSGNGKLEMPLADLMSELDAAVYVLDCLPNLRPREVTARAAPFVRKLRAARPNTPIVLVEDRTYQDAHVNGRRLQRNHGNRAALKAAYEALCKAGVKGLHYVEGKGLLGDDGEATVDGSHPTDLGFMRQADVLEKALRTALKR